MKVVVDEHIPFIKGLVETLADEVVYRPGVSINADTVKDADALIVRTRTRCDANLLDGSKVRQIITATIGYDHIDTSYCDAHHITWTNCPGCNAGSVATYLRNTLQFLTERTEQEIHCVGVIGKGHVGSLVAEQAELLGLRVLCYDPFVLSGVLLQPLLDEADVLTFHVPLSRDGDYPTFHMANKKFFDALKRSPIIINTSRGGVVDEQALLQAMDEGKVRGCVIDTWENEPQIDRELLRRALIATPHIAGYSVNGKLNATHMSLQALAKHWSKPALYGRFEEPADAELLTVYTLMSDSDKLKSSPEMFEDFRSHYPRRKEK